jgi:hypothetical protein
MLVTILRNRSSAEAWGTFTETSKTGILSQDSLILNPTFSTSNYCVLLFIYQFRIEETFTECIIYTYKNMKPTKKKDKKD